MCKKSVHVMPAEYEKHEGTLLIWPHRKGSFGINQKKAYEAFYQVASHILESEKLFLIVNKKNKGDVLNLFADHENKHRLTFLKMETDDSWARDTGPTFIRMEQKISGINWQFNAWGGTYNGLYDSWEKDQEVAKNVCEKLGYDCIDSSDFVLEGGSIHSDGEGTLLVTETCLLSKGRNPDLSKEQIENKLKDQLGVEKVLWLPCGIYMDETDEHVDNICAFIASNEVVLAWTDNEEDEQYKMSKKCYDYLNEQVDAKGKKLIIHKLPIPDYPVLWTKEDSDNYEFELGEDMRDVGERLAASYVNFYFTNNAVLLPFFGGKNKSSDERAYGILKQIVKNREIIPIDAMAILKGGGNIHCITQQIPSI